MLQYFVEYLLANPKLAGELSIQKGLLQAIVADFPANTTVYFTISPPAGMYSIVKYRTWFGHDMVPNVFDFTVAHRGVRVIGGTYTAGVIDTELPGFIAVTANHPITCMMHNTSPLDQYMEYNCEYIILWSEEMYKQMWIELKKLQAHPELVA